MIYEKNIVVINDNYSEALINEIRDQETDSDALKDMLYSLGQKAGQVISGELLTEEKTVITPMGYQHRGIHLTSKQVVIVSTKDDYEHFARGLSSTMKNVIRGYMDFEGARGVQALSQPIRSIKLPELCDKGNVNCIIIAKSILATGCTAISLTKKAIELYNPLTIVIAAVFYTEQGIYDLLSQIATARIYVFGESDKLDNDGMLVPGVGNLDTRIND